MAKPKPRQRRTEYPMKDDTVRPIRFWNATEGELVPHRFYAEVNLRACIGLWVETVRARKVGTTLEMIDVTKGKLITQSTLRIDGVEYPEGMEVMVKAALAPQ